MTLAGTQVGGKYRLIALLGEGGMGAVYEATDPSGRPVALKLLHEGADATALARFAREAGAASTLAHPNIVRVLDFQANPGEPPFLVMERIRGRTLSEILQAEGALSPSRAAHIAIQVLDALAVAHAAGITHRDVKPGNVVVCASPSADFVKLVDFGIAKLPAFTTKLTRTGAPLGTLAYMAPEQILGLDVDGRADVYAVGATLYHAIAGRHAFAAANPSLLMRAVCMTPHAPLVSICGGVDARFSEVVDRAMAKDPSRRFSSAAEMADALRALRRDAVLSTMVAPPPRSVAMTDVPASTRAGTDLPRIGDLVLEKFRIDRVVGRGGMGIVYAARHELLEQSVALKLLLRGATKEATTNFVNEAKLAARIRSDHVPRVLDVGMLEDGVPYIAMDLLRGTDLSCRLRERGPLAVGEAARFVLEALDALAQAHALRIVHRDLKPSNLFLEQRDDGTEIVKVLDFGISKADGDNPVSMGSGAVLGSPGYMAPEQIRDASNVDARADIWAMGVVLYELLTQGSPFPGMNAGEVFMKILDRAPEPLAVKRPDVSPELVGVVMRCLEKAPQRRYANVLELAWALTPFAAGRHEERLARIRAAIEGKDARSDSRGSLPPLSPIEAAPTVQAWTGEAMAAVARSGSNDVRRRNPGRWAAALAILAALGVVGSFAAYRAHRSLEPPIAPVATNAPPLDTAPPPGTTTAPPPDLSASTPLAMPDLAPPVSADATPQPAVPRASTAIAPAKRSRAAPSSTIDRRSVLKDRGD